MIVMIKQKQLRMMISIVRAIIYQYGLGNWNTDGRVVWAGFNNDGRTDIIGKSRLIIESIVGVFAGFFVIET